MSHKSNTTLNYSHIVTSSHQQKKRISQVDDPISLDGTIGLLQCGDDGETIAIIGAKDLGEIFYQNQEVFANVNETIKALEQVLQEEIGNSSLRINVIDQDTQVMYRQTSNLIRKRLVNQDQLVDISELEVTLSQSQIQESDTSASGTSESQNDISNYIGKELYLPTKYEIKSIRAKVKAKRVMTKIRKAFKNSMFGMPVYI